MSLALYPSDAATAAPSDSPALRPAQPAPTLVEGQGCCQDKEEANLSKLGLRPHHPRQGEPEDLLPDAEMRFPPQFNISQLSSKPSSSSAARPSLRIAHEPFCKRAQQQAPPPRGPILSELASVNGRGGGDLLEMPAPRRGKRLPGAEGPPEGV